MKKKSNFITLMFFPESNGKTFTLRIHKYILLSISIIFFIFFSGLIMLLFKSGEIAAKLQLLHVIKSENEKLSSENSQLRALSYKIENIEKFCRYIEKLAIVDEKTNNLESEIKILYKKDNSNKLNLNIDSVSEKYVSIPNISPVEGWITRTFSPDSINGHQGIDFAASRGTPIRATAPGVVEEINIDKYLGLIITIKHEHGYSTRYGHCSQVLISKHEKVNRGQTVALVGNTGRSTAPHLHYEVLKNGKNVDPARFLLIQND